MSDLEAVHEGSELREFDEHVGLHVAVDVDHRIHLEVGDRDLHALHKQKQVQYCFCRRLYR